MPLTSRPGGQTTAQLSLRKPPCGRRDEKKKGKDPNRKPEIGSRGMSGSQRAPIDLEELPVSAECNDKQGSRALWNNDLMIWQGNCIAPETE